MVNVQGDPGEQRLHDNPSEFVQSLSPMVQVPVRRILFLATAVGQDTWKPVTPFFGEENGIGEVWGRDLYLCNLVKVCAVSFKRVGMTV